MAIHRLDHGHPLFPNPEGTDTDLSGDERYAFFEQRAVEDWRAKWINKWTTKEATDDKPRPGDNLITKDEVIILGIDPDKPPRDIPLSN